MTIIIIIIRYCSVVRLENLNARARAAVRIRYTNNVRYIAVNREYALRANYDSLTFSHNLAQCVKQHARLFARYEFVRDNIICTA